MDYIKAIAVADDEPMQLEILSQLLAGIVPEASVFSCANGSEVLALLEETAVDVLITDIRMPVMDGMELIEKVASEYPAVKIVLISAYQKFEYARNALLFGVFDYLVKPFRVEAVSSILEKINAKIKEETEQELQRSYNEQIARLYHRDSGRERLAMLIRGQISADALEERVYEDLCRQGTVLAFRWRTGERTDGKGRGIRHAGLAPLLAERFDGAYPVPHGKGLDRRMERLLLLAPGFSDEDCVRILRELQAECKKQGIVFWCGVSETCGQLLDQIRGAAAQAEEMLSFSFFTADSAEGDIFRWEEYSENLNQPGRFLPELERELRKYVCQGDISSVEERLSAAEEIYCAPPFSSAFKVKHTVSSMVVRILSELEGIVPRAEYDSLINETYDQYGKCDSCGKLFEISRRLLAQGCAYYGQESEAPDTVEEIVLYIKRHYREDLSLQRLSEITHFSSGYLSAQIKKKTGRTYVEYLLSLRLEEARHLLLHSGSKVIDIMKQCGFHDSSYFNRVFRRYFAMSPEQYRKEHVNVEKDL